MTMSILVCLGSFFVLLFALRSQSVSLGLPLAYLFALLLIHVPGAAACPSAISCPVEYVERGINLTAIGSVCFVGGAIFIGWFFGAPPAVARANRGRFATFCLFGGWFVNYGLSFLEKIPSLGAAVDKSGALWMLGVMLGLRAAVRRSDPAGTFFWGAAMLVYPVLMLVLGGFFSYGSTAMIIVLAILLICTRRSVVVVIGLIIGTYVGMSVFVNYFEHRNEIRAEAWTDAPVENKFEAAWSIGHNFEFFSLENPRHVFALSERLNQNYFVGLAASRIDAGVVAYLNGRSIWQGLVALVPRAIWPDKPVSAGSPEVVSKMTGLMLNSNTSFGVGNVMEFQINFGIPGLIGGFMLLGMLLRYLDRKAAEADRQGEFGRLIVFFLPAVAVIQPNGSVVEMTSGSAAALIGAFGWRWGWQYYLSFKTKSGQRPQAVAGARRA